MGYRTFKEGYHDATADAIEDAGFYVFLSLIFGVSGAYAFGR